MLKFSNGENINTSGPLRITTRRDGLYVIGQGHLIPIIDRNAGYELIKKLGGNLETNKI